MELAGTVPARDLLAGARTRGGDGFTYTVVNRQVKGTINCCHSPPDGVMSLSYALLMVSKKVG
jgi:hypothetical protein